MFQQIYNDDDLEDMSDDEGDDDQEHVDEGSICVRAYCITCMLFCVHVVLCAC